MRGWPTARRREEGAFERAIVKDELNALKTVRTLESHLRQCNLFMSKQVHNLAWLRPIKVILVTVALNAYQFHFRQLYRAHKCCNIFYIVIVITVFFWLLFRRICGFMRMLGNKVIDIFVDYRYFTTFNSKVVNETAPMSLFGSIYPDWTVVHTDST